MTRGVGALRFGLAMKNNREIVSLASDEVMEAVRIIVDDTDRGNKLIFEVLAMVDGQPKMRQVRSLHILGHLATIRDFAAAEADCEPYYDQPCLQTTSGSWAKLRHTFSHVERINRVKLAGFAEQIPV